MEGIAIKIGYFFLKALISIPLIVCVWICGKAGDDSMLNDWFNENDIDFFMNIFSILYIALLSATKLSIGGLDIHQIFEGIFFYIGGIGSLVWIAFKLKLSYLDHKIKKNTLKEQESKI